jgi:hypothetical protein
MISKEETFKRYLRALEAANYEEIMALFAKDATVESPLYGYVKAYQFYKDLLSDTTSSKITLKNIFMGATNQDSAALYFEYIWTLKDGQIVKFEVIDVFDFDFENKIKNLKIIYDTYNVRPEFQKNR